MQILKNTLDFVIQLPDNGDVGESKFLSKNKIRKIYIAKKQFYLLQ